MEHVAFGRGALANELGTLVATSLLRRLGIKDLAPLEEEMKDFAAAPAQNLEAEESGRFSQQVLERPTESSENFSMRTNASLMARRFCAASGPFGEWRSSTTSTIEAQMACRIER